MRLLSIWVSQYQVLRDFEVDFSAGGAGDRRGYDIDFLVGLNGSGKSTVLRLIVETILRLEGARGSQHSFPYEFRLVYQRRGAAPAGADGDEPAPPADADGDKQTITITYQPSHDQEREATQQDPDADRRPPIRILAEEGPEDFRDSSLLPDQVIVLTSGQEHEWEQIERLRVADPDPQPLSARLRGRSVLSESRSHGGQPGTPQTREASRVVFVRSHQLPLLMLCALLQRRLPRPAGEQRGTDGFGEALQQSNIGRLAGFALRFQLDGPATLADDPGHPINRLAKTEPRPTRLRRGNERRLVFTLPPDDGAQVAALADQFEGSFWRMFRALAELCQSSNPAENTLQDMAVFLERPKGSGDDAPLHLFNWMSDGEQSFLGRMALLALLGESEALILLDEPEVHFNDYWKRRIGKLIDQSLKGSASHIIVTTHSSITLTDVYREDIVKIKRGGTYTTGTPEQVPIHTLAADPSDVMVHVFETGHATGEYAVDLISRLAGSGRTMSGGERAAAKQIQEHVAPGYWSYLLRRALLDSAPDTRTQPGEGADGAV